MKVSPPVFGHAERPKILTGFWALYIVEAQHHPHLRALSNLDVHIAIGLGSLIPHKFNVATIIHLRVLALHVSQFPNLSCLPEQREHYVKLYEMLAEAKAKEDQVSEQINKEDLKKLRISIDTKSENLEQSQIVRTRFIRSLSVTPWRGITISRVRRDSQSKTSTITTW